MYIYSTTVWYLTDRTIDMVAVKIVWPWPSGRSWTDWRASAKAIAPLSSEQAKEPKLMNIITKILNSSSEHDFQDAYHWTKVPTGISWVFSSGVAAPNLASKHMRKHLQPFKTTAYEKTINDKHVLGWPREKELDCIVNKKDGHSNSCQKKKKYPNMGGLGVHLHPQPTEQGSVHRTWENYQTN
jgi:hypothetical protein